MADVSGAIPGGKGSCEAWSQIFTSCIEIWSPWSSATVSPKSKGHRTVGVIKVRCSTLQASFLIYDWPTLAHIAALLQERRTFDKYCKALHWFGA